jgi:P27 family predicted phage terminase small subunit
MGAKLLPIRGGFPEPPKELGENGRLAWDHGIDLWAEGVIQKRDLPNWILYAKAFDDVARFSKDAEEEPYVQTSQGSIIAHPAFRLKAMAENVIRKYSQLYGLVPNARQKRPPTNKSQGVTQRTR